MIVISLLITFLSQKSLAEGLDSLRITGRSSFAHIIKNQAIEFGKANHVGIHFQDSSSIGSIKCVGDATCDIGLNGLAGQKRGNDPKFEAVPFAIDSIAFLVHPSVNLKDLSLDQLRGIYSGKYTNWSELGGRDLKIKLFRRSGFAEKDVLNLKSDPIGTETSSAAEALNRAKVTIGAIATSGLSLAKAEDEKGGVHLIAINGQMPTPENLRAGKYPFLVNLYFLIPVDSAKRELAKRLIDDLLSKREELLSNTGLISP